MLSLCDNNNNINIFSHTAHIGLSKALYKIHVLSSLEIIAIKGCYYFLCSCHRALTKEGIFVLNSTTYLNMMAFPC